MWLVHVPLWSQGGDSQTPVLPTQYSCLTQIPALWDPCLPCIPTLWDSDPCPLGSLPAQIPFCPRSLPSGIPGLHPSPLGSLGSSGIPVSPTSLAKIPACPRSLPSGIPACPASLHSGIPAYFRSLPSGIPAPHPCPRSLPVPHPCPLGSLPCIPALWDPCLPRIWCPKAIVGGGSHQCLMAGDPQLGTLRSVPDCAVLSRGRVHF